MNKRNKKFPLEQTSKQRNILSEDELEKLLNCSDEEMRLFILTVTSTGMRMNEICSLSKSEIQEIKIPVLLKEVLHSYAKSMNDDQVIFYKTPQFYRNQLEVIAEKAKVNKNKVYHHSLRHYFIRKGGEEE